MTVSKHTPRLQDIYNTAQRSRLKKHYTARSFLRIWSYLLKKFLMENFIFRAVSQRQLWKWISELVMILFISAFLVLFGIFLFIFG